MGWIAPAVAAHSRVCVYDRAGRGWSDPSDNTQDGEQIATDLHTLLHRGHVPGPYVLAGHSFGGLYVRIFAARYPHEVAGMVLIDSTGSALPASTSAQSWGPDDLLARASVLASTLARLGVGRLIGLGGGYGTLPPQSADEVRAKNATSTSLRSTIDEFLQANASEHEAATLTNFSDKPLVVLTAGSGSAATWMAAQNQTATMSTNSVHRVVEGATHPDLILKQADAAVTAQAIINVVSSVRNKPTVSQMISNAGRLTMLPSQHPDIPAGRAHNAGHFGVSTPRATTPELLTAARGVPGGADVGPAPGRDRD
jgi:pimeloyl-ACP methyl ester carboxylesterase